MAVKFLKLDRYRYVIKKTILPTLIFILLISVTFLNAEDKLIFAVTLTRHGDRTPTHLLKNDTHDWKIGLGELTPLGMHQQYILGTKLRTRYIDQLKLLPAMYKNNIMYVRSTDLNRTIMSAESLLTGLYPPGTGPLLRDGTPALPAACQPIPVRTLPATHDYQLLKKDVSLDYVKEQWKKYVYNQKDWNEKDKEFQGNYRKWSKIFGDKIEKLQDIIPIGDNLNVRLKNHIPLPEGMSTKEALSIINIAQWAQAKRFEPLEISSFLASTFLVELQKNMALAVEGKQKYKYILYSGHDSSILPVMSAIGSPLTQTPPYASHLDFELYKNNNNYFIKARFNNEPVKVFGHETCTFDEFTNSIQNLLKQQHQKKR